MKKKGIVIWRHVICPPLLWQQKKCKYVLFHSMLGHAMSCPPTLCLLLDQFRNNTSPAQGSWDYRQLLSSILCDQITVMG